MSAQSFTPHQIRSNTASDECHYPPDNDPIVSYVFTTKIEEFNLNWSQASPLQRQDIIWVSTMINRLMDDSRVGFDEGRKVKEAESLWKICCQIDSLEPGSRRRWLRQDMRIELHHGIAIIQPSVGGIVGVQNLWGQPPKQGLPPPFLQNDPRYKPSPSLASQPQQHMQPQQPVQHQQPVMNHQNIQQDGKQRGRKRKSRSE